MLLDLKVKNFALIEKLEINFKKGLNVLTGETGAGKSIIIGALEMLLGGRASREVIRNGKDKAYIEAVYEPEKLDLINNKLEEYGIEPDEDILLLSREIKRTGRNRSRINGQLATLSMVSNVSSYLVDIHGQHEHQSLLDVKLHLDFLDDFIGEKIISLKEKVTNKYNEIKNINKKLQEMEIDEGEKARELDLLEFQINEIENANLKTGEFKKLEKEYKKLSNAEDIFATTGMIYNDINGDDFNNNGILDKIGHFMTELDSLKEYDDKLDSFHSQMENIYYTLQDLGYEIREYNENLDFDKKRLKEIEDRLDTINNLKKKYGETIEEILEYNQKMKKRRNELVSQEDLINELKEKRKNIKAEYYNKAEELSKIRKNSAKNLEEKIKDELTDLAMEDVLFKVKFEEKDLAGDGIDDIEFMISPNPGEDLKPLAKIASGGELSRIMLAFKKIIAEIDKVDTLIFDEVDSGVGGKTAQKMAEKLAVIGSKRQVICITHLPQIASMSDNHFYINKTAENGKTYTNINKLNGEEKPKELARMLGGVKMTDTTLDHAEEMIKLAEKKKKEI
ncbi:MAG TPA: DNA repair protein RecN [Halanaerobiales bacterium]|nr:DNA repair protein RecN [Halanaerobiales bacterium]